MDHRQEALLTLSPSCSFILQTVALEWKSFGDIRFSKYLQQII